ncbi:RNA pseudouridine synthase [Rhodoblastus acidophilus]|uniref:RNA pseudouridine synthase n=1 Tax=Candidatus Rhodoblastus alkanivorans TaxID=2954117 RepID=A0ABS9Z1R4_9HYPH|nr:RNA pseudouridine synthase [Candidatus Rhodoblastus alkanivorans]MCI4678078.1 RNA pseudouridine synthase [Candidatus Rhodoblastus alkanivorans]MCI4681581.1 RNA pseudouridine synthase [Candidatus Rhodoblastus alkanivorans]MDI4642629.1 RNA pseudouridine synthase [Rhodoblastus acidophilus]
MTPEEIYARLLYRDGLILVLDKPAGLPVHRGPKGGENFEQYFFHLRFGLPRDPSLAHRLDRDTSGCLVLGRHRKALEKLMHLFKQGRIEKTYWAVVQGGPEQNEGLIDLPLGRLDATRGWWMKVDPDGLPAQTRWRVLGRGHDSDGAPLAWLELAPLTGRTHQLRVHCAALDFPIFGDPIYGAGREPEELLHLHARAVKIPLSNNKPPIEVEACAPDHMKKRLAACGWTQNLDDDTIVARQERENERERARLEAKVEGD